MKVREKTYKNGRNFFTITKKLFLYGPAPLITAPHFSNLTVPSATFDNRSGGIYGIINLKSFIILGASFMQTRRQQPADHSGAIWGLWLILQLTNIFWAVTYANASAGTVSWRYGLISPWWPFQFLLNYLLFRTINYWICRLLGYHAASAGLIANLGQQRGNAQSATGLRWPQFIRTTADYRRRYQTRAGSLQFLFQLSVIILVPTYAYWGFRWSLFLPGVANASKLVVQLVLVAAVGYALTRGYYWLFQHVFNLQTILVEHGQPIFAHQQPNLARQAANRGNAQPGSNKFYETGRVVVQSPNEKE